MRQTKQLSAPGPFVGKTSPPLVSSLFSNPPPSAPIGTVAWVTRLLGTGYFQIMFNGTRWVVVPGQCVARLENPILLTATGTAYVQLVSVLVGPLIADYETWLFRAGGRNDGIYTVPSVLNVRNSGSAVTIGSGTTISAANQRGRRIGNVRRFGNIFQRVTSQPESYSNATASDYTVPDWNTFSMEAGFTPGSAGDTLRLDEFSLIRES